MEFCSIIAAFVLQHFVGFFGQSITENALARVVSSCSLLSAD